jgi:hypothetical protein
MAEVVHRMTPRSGAHALERNITPHGLGTVESACAAIDTGTTSDVGTYSLFDDRQCENPWLQHKLPNRISAGGGTRTLFSYLQILPASIAKCENTSLYFTLVICNCGQIAATERPRQRWAHSFGHS